MIRVFLTFAEQDADRVKGLLPLLQRPEYELVSCPEVFSIGFDSPEAEAARRMLGEKIVTCNVTVCLIGEHTHNDKWVGSALQKSLHKGNRVIAMAMKNIEIAALPHLIRQENLKFYPWNPKKLADLILAQAGPWHFG